MAQVITLEIQELALRRFTLERLGFLTLTFSDNVTNVKVARKRFHSLATHVLRKRYPASIWVIERQRSGRLHFHGVVVCDQDIRTGVNFAEIEEGKYASAGHYLRSEWAFWRNAAPSYKFGRTELLPIRSTAEGIARYVGKYISKHIGQREERDKGARLASFIGYGPGDRKASTVFAYHTPNGWAWRRKLEAYCKLYDKTMPALKEMFGSRWCYYLQADIVGLRLSQVYGQFTYPTCWHAIACGESVPSPDEYDIDLSAPFWVGGDRRLLDRGIIMPSPDIESEIQRIQSWAELEEGRVMAREKEKSESFDEIVEYIKKVKIERRG